MTTKDKKPLDPEKTIIAKWAVDTETGKRYLIDLETETIIAVWPLKEIKIQ